MRRWLAIALVAGLQIGTAVAQPATSPPSSRSNIEVRYDKAAGFAPWKLQGQVLNLRFEPHWIGRDRLWYRRETEKGYEFVVADLKSRTQGPAFPHDAVAAGLAAALGTEVSPARLPIDSFEFGSAPGEVTVRSGAVVFVCDTKARACLKTPGASKPPGALPSPDGRLFAFARANNLWLFDAQTGSERALTSDGEPHYGYGAMPEMTIFNLRSRRGGGSAPYGTIWAPDSRRIVAPQVDERAVDDLYLLESAPAGLAPRPVLHVKKSSRTGDTEQVYGAYAVIDTVSGNSVRIQMDRADAEYILLAPETTSWSADGRFLYTTSRSRYGQSGRVLEIDTTLGKTRVVLEETSDNNLLFNSVADGGGPNVRFLPESNELIWFSERDGWGHLYLYDLRTGRLKNQITRGSWLVRDIIDVDPASRTIFFTAGGREAGRNPYYRHLYRVRFDGSGLKLLTRENADHEFSGWPGARFGISPATPGPAPAYVGPGATYFTDTLSTVSDPPRTVVRRASDGAVVMNLVNAEASKLRALGWRPPEPFTVKAADGQTDLYGLIYRPTDFDPSKRYPVLDHIYQGPNLSVVPWNFGGFEEFFNAEMQARAELGFIIVQLDGRGTANRSRAFRDASYGKLSEFRIDDHVAAIRALAERNPQMNLDRVGIYGHSFGGFATARAMLLYPDFFKAGISAGGIHNYEGAFGNWATQFFGPLDASKLKDGHMIELPAQYRAADNRRIADRLQGPLMLAYGDLDENTGAATVLQFASALTDANKSFDLVYLAGRDHYFHQDPYFLRRSWDFLTQHLLGETPPKNYDLAPPPATR